MRNPVFAELASSHHCVLSETHLVRSIALSRAFFVSIFIVRRTHSRNLPEEIPPTEAAFFLLSLSASLSA
jgi:hypothetical protein